MKKWILAITAAAAMALASPATAQDQQNAAPSSNPAGMGNAYGYSMPTLGDGYCCKDPVDGYDHDHANDNAIAVMTNFNQKLAAMQLAIIEAMRLSTGQLSGNLREQSGADHTLADQQDDRATVKAVEEARLRAIQDATSSAGGCWVITGSRGGGSVMARNRYARELAASLGQLERGEAGPAKNGQSANLLATLEVHCQNYANEADVSAGLCENEGALPSADIDATESLFFRKDDLMSTYDAQRSDAAKAFTKHAVSLYSHTPIDKTKAHTIEGREEAARRNAQLARSSIAHAVFSEAQARRQPAQDDKLVSWARDMVSGMAGYQGASFPDGLSEHDWLEIFSRGYMLKGDDLLAADENWVSAIKDTKNMTAIQLYQGWEQIKLLERISVTLATQLAILNENTRTDIRR